VKSITFHSKALVFIRGQSPAIKREIGEALRDVQKGIRLGLPLSRPMPGIASGAHELRVRDSTATVRVFYFVTWLTRLWCFMAFRSKHRRHLSMKSLWPDND
jgi:phage-related protein